MEYPIEGSTRTGWGFSAVPDAFHAGREAAQMAKAQMGEGPPDLAMVLVSDNLRFKDVLEGTRLIIGGENLIGLTATQIFSTEIPGNTGCLVILFRSPGMRFSLATTENDVSNPMRCSSTLLTQFRQNRGSLREDFDHHGVITILNQPGEDTGQFAHELSTGTGLESWGIGFSPSTTVDHALSCHNRFIFDGIIGIECLSDSPWGIGSVSITSFLHQPGIYRKAIQAALRDAQSQLIDGKTSFGLLFLNSLPSTPLSDLRATLESVEPLLSQVPLVGISTKSQFVRMMGRPSHLLDESVIALLVPQ